MNAKEMLGDYLRRKDLKSTAVRSDTAQVAYSLKGHFDTEVLLSEAKKANSSISRASVYRAVPLLIDAGIIQESVLVDGRKVFESCCGRNSKHHDHMICDKCGSITEFKDEVIEKRQEMIAKKHGFKMKEHRLVLRGICGKCSGRKG